MNLRAVEKWHNTSLGLVAFALIELAITYGLASWAIDNGSLWLYMATLIFLVGALQNIARLLNKLFTLKHG